jgi:hypothetical protein
MTGPFEWARWGAAHASKGGDRSCISRDGIAGRPLRGIAPLDRKEMNRHTPCTEVAVLAGSLRKASLRRSTWTPESLRQRIVEIGQLPHNDQSADDNGVPPSSWLAFRNTITLPNRLGRRQHRLRAAAGAIGGQRRNRLVGIATRSDLRKWQANRTTCATFTRCEFGVTLRIRISTSLRDSGQADTTLCVSERIFEPDSRDAEVIDL